ncbi:hypothetical protein ACN27F_25800 [Solwaraspora sp. WMMB335]|uniref:hypothetical protein n=1 Tax=Solwaraspora sp. WMMB335 TaxID=3404118 RepID=UPI003B92990D
MRGHRKFAGRIAFLPLVVALATAGCAGDDVGGAPDPELSTDRGENVDATHGTSDDLLGCGQLFDVPADGVLTVAAQLPRTASAADRMVTGAVEVTSQRPVRGVVGQRAEMFLVRDGRVVGVPLPQDLLGVQWDLAAGQVEQLPGDVTLMSCEPGAGSVPPGDYEVYARVTIVPDDGPAMPSFGGPWSLRVS